MRIFVTGATGYIGRVVIEKLRAAGHAVAGLARSDEAERKLRDAGAEAVRGELADAHALRSAAAAAGGAVHLAMEFSPEAARLDRTAIGAVLEGLGESGKPFLYTSGIWVLGSTGDAAADESTPLDPTPLVAWRPAHEQLVLRAAGVRGIVIRPAMVYGRGGGAAGGFRKAALSEGVVRHVGDGANRWPFVHVDDLADLYVLALDAPAGSLYFASAGDSHPVAEVARAAARGARVEAIPLEQARQTMGPLADALTLDQRISSARAQRELGWRPQRPGVVEELEAA